MTITPGWVSSGDSCLLLAPLTKAVVDLDRLGTRGSVDWRAHHGWLTDP